MTTARAIPCNNLVTTFVYPAKIPYIWRGFKARNDQTMRPLHDTIHSLPEFESLFERHKSKFVAVALSYVRDSMVAEDIVADCFAYYWENRDSIDIEKSIPAYILASVKNRCLNHLRNERTHLKSHLNLHSHSLRVVAERIATLETSEPDGFFEDEIASIVEKRLEAMPPKMRNVFTASRIDGLTYKQIAEKYDLSFNQVDFEMRKATNALSRALKDYIPKQV